MIYPFSFILKRNNILIIICTIQISNHLKAISCNENFHPSYKKLGILFMARGDNESAIEYFQDYLNFDLPKEEKQNIQDLIKRIS